MPDEEDKPISKKEAAEIRKRVRVLEDYFFAFKVLSGAVVSVSIFLGYMAQNWMAIKNFFLQILGAK